MITRIFYNLLYCVLLAPFAAVFAILSPARFARELRASWKERLGIYPASSSASSDDEPVVVVRCASLGETKVALKFIPNIKGFRFVIAAGTLSARDYARGYMKARDIVFTPPDIVPFVRNFFVIFRPIAVVFVESDLWPEFLRGAKEAGARAILVNGRFSPSSAAFAGRFKKLSLTALAPMDKFLVRYDSDAASLASIGMPPGKMLALGNIKYDFDVPPVSSDKSSLGYSDTDFLLVAGSTHCEDEKVLASALGDIFTALPNLKLAVVPRHIDRRAETASILSAFAPVMQSFVEAETGRTAPRCLIVDKMGELDKYYSIANVAFVGGSFGNRGGQEPMTPAYFAKPIIYGPRMTKFLDETSRLEAAGGAIRASSPRDFAEALGRFIKEPEYAVAVGQKAKSASSAECGAAGRASAILAEFLNQK
ncbi:MAG: glycosyltransferase N-terminal domain-containing protein [Endomicrobiia bacterium]|nr:glycosyltransferase N-terminal domain-containing protein [Endomicrobiia bacterium]